MYFWYCYNYLVTKNRKGAKGKPDIIGMSFGQLHQCYFTLPHSLQIIGGRGWTKGRWAHEQWNWNGIGEMPASHTQEQRSLARVDRVQAACKNLWIDNPPNQGASSRDALGSRGSLVLTHVPSIAMWACKPYT